MMNPSRGRTIGLTVNNYPYTESLLNHLPKGRKPATEEAIPTPPTTSSDGDPKPTAVDTTMDSSNDEQRIYAPPLDSSDEDSLSNYGSPSPRNEAGIGMQVTNTQQTMDTSSSDRLSSEPEDLYNPGSNIRHTDFSFKREGARSSIQQNGNKKRVSHMTSGDEFGEDWCNPQKSKKAKRGKTYGKTNTRSPAVKTENKSGGNTQDVISSTGRKIPKFRKLDSAKALSTVDKIEKQRAEMKVEDDEPSTESPQTSTTPRSERATNRQKKVLNGFKIPPQVPSRKATPRKFKVPPIIPNSMSPRNTRSNTSFKKPELLTAGNGPYTNNLKNLLENTTNKLDQSNQQLISSSITASSLPSTSNEPLSSSSSISSAPDSPELEASILGFDFDKLDLPHFREPPSMTKCPLCKAPVERGFLEAFECGKRLNMRQQARFCKAHRARSAESEWEAKGYPKIDWEHFDERLTRFHRDLENILTGNKPSYYQTAFEEHLKTEQKQTLQQIYMDTSNMDGLEPPGYYGSRGAKLMIENIMTHLAPRIRDLASTHKPLASGGVPRYVQTVLAPELATMLVMQDMRTDEEGARKVLADSVEVGELLNEEADEVIRDPEPDRVGVGL